MYCDNNRNRLSITNNKYDKSDLVLMKMFTKKSQRGADN